MRIAIIAHSIDRNKSGISQYTRQLIMQLKKNHELTVVHLKKSDDPLFSGVKEVLIPRFFHSSPMIRLYMNLFLRNLDADIVYHPSPIGFFFPVKSKLVQAVHDMIPLKLPETQKPLGRLSYKLLIKKYARTADAVITLSEHSKRDVCSMLGISPDKVHVTPLASFYTAPSKSEVQRVKEKYSIAYPYFIFIGTLEARKNIVRMLQAFAQSGVPYHFVLVGSPGFKFDEILGTIRKLNLSERVHILRGVPNEDIPALYACAEALVFATLYEGFGLPVVEAMSCGCPVIAGNVSSIPEVGGDAVLYCNPYDVNDISAAMKEVGKKRTTLVKKGFNQAKKFSWEKTAELTIDAFEKLKSGK